MNTELAEQAGEHSLSRWKFTHIQQPGSTSGLVATGLLPFQGEEALLTTICFTTDVLSH